MVSSLLILRVCIPSLLHTFYTHPSHPPLLDHTDILHTVQVMKLLKMLFYPFSIAQSVFSRNILHILDVWMKQQYNHVFCSYISSCLYFGNEDWFECDLFLFLWQTQHPAVGYTADRHWVRPPSGHPLVLPATIQHTDWSLPRPTQSARTDSFLYSCCSVNGARYSQTLKVFQKEIICRAVYPVKKTLQGAKIRYFLEVSFGTIPTLVTH